MNYIPAESFAGILSAAMDAYGVGCKRFEEILQDRGVDGIKYKRISEYRNGHFTPSYEKARLMLDALEFPISDEDLIRALDLNRSLIKEEQSYYVTDSKELRLSVRLKYRNILREYTPEETELFLRQRIADLFGDDKYKSQYIERLIAKDLKEYIIDKEDLESEQN